VWTWDGIGGKHQNNFSRSARSRCNGDSHPFSPSWTSAPFIPSPFLPYSPLSTLLGLVSTEGLPWNMDIQRKSCQPSFHLVSSPIPAQPISTRVQNHKQSESPFRYLTEGLASEQVFSEKDQTPLADIPASSGKRTSSVSRAAHRSSPPTSRSSTPAPSRHRAHPKHPSQHGRLTTPGHLLAAADNGRGRPSRRVGQLERSHWPSLSTRMQPWMPIILYGISSLGFVVAIAFWKTEIFQGTETSRAVCPAADLHPFLGLDDLSHYLQAEGSYGYGVIFLLIWVTTFRKS
jgi:hypothetical protein